MKSRRTPRKPVTPKKNLAAKTAIEWESGAGPQGPADRIGRRDNAANGTGRTVTIAPEELVKGFKQLEKLLQKQIEQSVDDARLRLTKFIKNELRSQISECIRDTLHKNIYDEISDQIHAQLRAEMEKRLAAIAAERTNLEPAKLLKVFTEQASELIEKSRSIKRSEKLTQEQVQQIIRNAILEALRSRRLHLTHLVELERLANDGMLEHVPDLLPGWFARAGLKRIDDPETHRELFEQIDKGKGPYLEVVEPAYIDAMTGQTIRSGRVRLDGSQSEQQPAMSDSTSGE